MLFESAVLEGVVGEVAFAAVMDVALVLVSGDPCRHREMGLVLLWTVVREIWAWG